LKIYNLDFYPSALREWNKLGATVQAEFRKKLTARLNAPRVPGDALSRMKDFYKIKLRSAGYRLVYQVQDDIVTVVVISVGQRNSNKEDAYDTAKQRLRDH
jgi:mRNA interferase RelE/StbE